LLLILSDWSLFANGWFVNGSISSFDHLDVVDGVEPKRLLSSGRDRNVVVLRVVGEPLSRLDFLPYERPVVR